MADGPKPARYGVVLDPTGLFLLWDRTACLPATDPDGGLLVYRSRDEARRAVIRRENPQADASGGHRHRNWPDRASPHRLS